MMKTAILSLLVSSGVVTAFAPSQVSRATSALGAMTFEDRPGVIPPVGYFDPLGLATSEQIFDYYREVEVKHGRVAQLAVIGFVVPEFFRFDYEIMPGVFTKEITNGWAALSEIPVLGWLWVFAAVGAVETKGWLRYDIGVPELAPEVLATRQTQELSNGRLAMLASMELFRHSAQNNAVPGFDGLDNLITGLPFLYN